MSSVIAQWAQAVKTVYANRRWLVALDHAMPAGQLAKQLLDLGAADAMALGASRGSGDPVDGIPTITMGVQANSMMASIRACESALHNVPPPVQTQIDAWDPDRTARVIRALFSDDTPVAQRACFGARPADWVALEDKTVIDALWAEIGVPHAPAQVVACDAEALWDAHDALDHGHGTVWAGDNTEGWHGGAALTRWVSDDETGARAYALLAKHCESVRVMPFLEGIPCSIHGVVFPQGTMALRPCEMVVFQDREAGVFSYAQAATLWDPPDADRAAMRAVAQRVGEALRERYAYRGAFTVDGVLTAEGFRPTELNPRFGAALNILGRSVPELPLYLLQLAIVAGESLPTDIRALEDALLERMDATRHAGCAILSTTRVDEQRTVGLHHDGHHWSLCDAETARITATVGPTSTGSRLRLDLDASALPAGAAVAPLAIAALQRVAGHLGLALPRLEAARDIRPN